MFMESFRAGRRLKVQGGSLDGGRGFTVLFGHVCGASDFLRPPQVWSEILICRTLSHTHANPNLVAQAPETNSVMKPQISKENTLSFNMMTPIFTLIHN